MPKRFLQILGIHKRVDIKVTVPKWKAVGPCLFGKCTAAFILASAITVSSVGCDDGRPKRVPVSGSVLIDGKPLTVGNIRFVPEGTRPSSGTLDSEGRFTLTCFDGEDGAVIGKHRVQISASDLTGKKVKWHAPKKYANFRTSGLTVDIEEPTDSLVLELTWDGEKSKRKKRK